MQNKKLMVLLVAVLALAGCGVSSYRDTLATSYGFIFWAQSTYKVQCQATPNVPTCALITRAIGLHNTAVSTLSGYCAGPPAKGADSWDKGGPCSPVKSLQSALEVALANLKVVIVDVKLLATGKSQPKLTAVELLERPETRDTLLAARLEVEP